MKTIIDENLNQASPVFFLNSEEWQILHDWPSEHALITGLVPWYNRGFWGRLKRWWYRLRFLDA